MQPIKKGLWRMITLIGTLSAVLVLVGAHDRAQATRTAPAAAGTHGNGDIVQLSTALVQDKLLIGSDGKISVALDLAVEEMPALTTDRPRQRIDLVVVLDRSGSMQGQKLDYARQAIVRMLDWLSPDDRLGLIIYDDTIQTLLPLTTVNESHRRIFAATVARIQAGGGTNLGGGLQVGIDAARHFPAEGRLRKVILISDGLANHGITDPAALGRMASGAVTHGIAVSTVGVGYDFNESLMTALADYGAGRYHFLENPQTFTAVLQHEFESTRNVAAVGLEIRLPLKNGLRLLDAGGYPIQTEGNVAVIQPGDLLSAERRRIFLTLQLPVDRARRHTISGLTVRYQHAGRPVTLTLPKPLTVACVADEAAVLGSIDKKVWGSQVVQEDFGRLKETVADAIRKGEKEEALKLIKTYESRTEAINSSVASPQVSENLEGEVQVLRRSVEDTFSGAPAAVAEKQKQNAKSLQYDGYKSRRDKK
jgi:Ca-activated chloride channel family protein